MDQSSFKALWHSAETLVTLDPQWITSDIPLGSIPNGAVATTADGTIAWVGLSSDLDLSALQSAGVICHDVSGQMLTPGLIDSHTHAIFAGDRSHEMEWRLAGETYQQIAAKGGGILTTVAATRTADEDSLYALTKARLQQMVAHGVSTIEAKSGYGLDEATELKCLRVLKRLQAEGASERSWQLRITYMGAHDIPPEYRDAPNGIDRYVDWLVTDGIPRVAELGLADTCDVFCETGYFTLAHTRRILETAQAHGLALKVHAEEFTTLGGAALAAEFGALSADHLLCIDDAGIQALAKSQTVATLLPGTAFFLRIPNYAPARQLIDAGATVALATDYNPGSCTIMSLPFIMQLGCLMMGMQVHEVIRAGTLNAAQALGLQTTCGSLSVGKRGDFAVFDVPHPSALIYHTAQHRCVQTVVTGHQAFLSCVK